MKIIMRWILVLMCISMIFRFSNQPLSDQDLRPTIEKHPEIIKIVQKMPQIAFYYHDRLVESHEDTVSFIHFMLRKLAHLVLYGTLGLLILYGFNGTGKIKPTYWILTGFLVFAIACADEINQFNNPARTGCKEDIILDFTGFLIFSLLAMFIYYIKTRYQNRGQRIENR